MADGEFDAGAAAGGDEDLSLPKATVAKLIQEMMPSEIVCARETRDLLTECCVEFIHLISSQANEICEKETKKTISGEHVISSLESLGFNEYVAEVMEVFNDHQKQQKDREKRTGRIDSSGMSKEELERLQEELFAKARQKNDEPSVSPVTVENESGPSISAMITEPN
ncbi:TATA binding protein-associated phosphoprotein [Cladochytrium replicatum]|nr:TATA binding protein-associated phosphoprotein [Cladochytrium replicatum]